jgi:hypothetical protein
MIVAFIEECRQGGHAVESICRVLREQGCQVAARTHRAWSRPGQQIAPRQYRHGAMAWNDLNAHGPWTPTTLTPATAGA